MKQPRTSDFDPKASKPAKPLKSSMDDFPTIEKPDDQQGPTVEQTPTSRTTVPPVRGVLPAPTGARRKIKSRHPFDIYEDQLEQLKNLSLQDRMRGGMGSMSAMVREALDDYFKKVQE